MTQISSADWKALVQSLPPEPPKSSGLGGDAALLSGSGLLAGVAIALVLSRLWRRWH
jgi:hypothetical protein